MPQNFRYGYGKRTVTLAIDNCSLSMATAQRAGYAGRTGGWGRPKPADGARLMPRTALPTPAGGEGEVGAWLRKVLRADAGAIQKRHPELDPALLGQMQEPLPHAQARPADEGLSRARPGRQVSGDGAPLRSILVSPEDGRDC